MTNEVDLKLADLAGNVNRQSLIKALEWSWIPSRLNAYHFLVTEFRLKQFVWIQTNKIKGLVNVEV